VTRTNTILKAKRILHLKLIGCEVLAREIYACAAFSLHVVDVELLHKGLHETPERLRASLQERILAVDEECDAVLLAYGLCGRSIYDKATTSQAIPSPLQSGGEGQGEGVLKSRPPPCPSRPFATLKASRGGGNADCHFGNKHLFLVPWGHASA